MLCFVQDDDGHWYKIPVSLRDKFFDELEYAEQNGDYGDFSFDEYRCLYPGNYMFEEDHIHILKESK